MTAGQPLYQLSSDLKYYKALNDTAVHAAAVGVALQGGAINQRIAMLTSGGILDTGTTVVLGATRYIVSTAAGGIAPLADVGSGKYITFLGYATTTGGKIQLTIEATGLATA